MKMLILYLLAALAALLLIAYAAGSALPQDHTATVTQDYAAPPEKIWTIITTPQQFMQWRTGLTKVDIQGENITEHSSYGAMSYRFIEQVPPRKVATQTDETGARERGFTGSWTFEITPTATGSRLTITERGKVFSPFFRLMARYLFGFESTMRQYHADLARRLGS